MYRDFTQLRSEILSFGTEIGVPEDILMKDEEDGMQVVLFERETSHTYIAYEYSHLFYQNENLVQVTFHGEGDSYDLDTSYAIEVTSTKVGITDLDETIQEYLDDGWQHQYQ